MNGPSIDELMAGGRIELIPPDAHAASTLLEEVARHLTSAAAIASADPNGANSLLYDAVRKDPLGRRDVHAMSPTHRR